MQNNCSEELACFDIPLPRFWFNAEVIAGPFELVLPDGKPCLRFDVVAQEGIWSALSMEQYQVFAFDEMLDAAREVKAGTQVRLHAEVMGNPFSEGEPDPVWFVFRLLELES